MFRILVLLAGLSLMIAACGETDDTAADDPAGDTTDEAADESDDEPDAGDAEDEPDDTADVDDAGDEEADDTAGAEGELVVYSGRNEELVDPIIEEFAAETGIETDVRYGDTAEMAAQILEEGDNSPADVFFGQDAGALGALAAEGRLAQLADEQLEPVADGLKDDDGQWVGLSGRARVVAFNTDAVAEDELPDAIFDYTDAEWEGRIGWAPTNGSFQAFVTAMRVLEGEDETRQWLEDIRDNGAVAYENNGGILDAVTAGEVEVGFVNHYYLHPRLTEDPDAPLEQKYYDDGDIGGLINVAGAGVLDTAPNADAANAFIDYMIDEPAQRYFAEETSEIPLTSGVDPIDGVPSFEELTVPDVDLNRLDDLEGTLDLLAEVGLL